MILKISAFLSCVEVIKCVKFQTPGFKGLKVHLSWHFPDKPY